MSDGGRLTNSLSPFIKTGIHVDLPNTLVKKTNKTNFWREWDMVGVKQVDFGGNWFVLGLLVKGGGGEGGRDGSQGAGSRSRPTCWR